MLDNLFINMAFDPSTRFLYFATVISVVISITLHELAHGWAAIRLGDMTPIKLGHMTGNPLVHMSPFSIAILFVAGIAWGQMPIDPSRLKGKYAEAWVAFAGPATNFMLALAALGGLGVWWRVGTFTDTQVLHNAVGFLFVFGAINVMLGIFNLFPVPPLDGSHILANFNRKFAQLMYDPAHQGLRLMAFIFFFSIAGVILAPVFGYAAQFTSWAAGNGMWMNYVDFFN